MKKIPQTDAIFENVLRENQASDENPKSLRVSFVVVEADFDYSQFFNFDARGYSCCNLWHNSHLRNRNRGDRSSCPDQSDRLLICVLIDVVACHNTLTLLLAKPNIFLLLASDRSKL
ncbi:hypothetical protein [Nostoc favosum]|uniref:Uncharacterized protein n=1 Tax=Nostoc favosum CHAB5714 TaxID=2780399 RepID=A0ABS8IN05_9NOSO|nr:hypothetical protein [Nostoc favosum]MCC5605056.1 hypothetical protein [Nostoc favosum CHAB5714]